MARRTTGELTRRRLLLGGAVVGGAVLGTGATAAAEAATAGPAAGAPTPGEALMTEHGVLKRVLLVYRAALARPWDAAAQQAVATGAAVVHDYVEGFHERLEEQHVFPVLADGPVGPTVATLLEQHGRGRQLTTALLALRSGTPSATQVDRARQQVDAFVRMYEVHEVVEDTEVFPALRQALGDRRLADLGERFAAEEERSLGRTALADALERVRSAERLVGAGDLAAVTPPRSLLG